MSQSGKSGGSREREAYTFKPEKVRAICDRIRAGSFVQHACERERVSVSGLYKAMERDEEIALDIREAQAESEEQTLATMRVNTFDWKREAWELERKRRDLFKPPKAESEVKSESKSEHTVSATVLVVTEAEMLAGAGRKIEGDGK